MSRVPARVAPMLATLVDAPFHRPGWIWEEKYDGIRLVALKDGRRVRLLSRNDKDRTADFPEVAAALAALPAATLVLDGEVVVFDAGGVSRFQLLQRRAEGASPPIYVAFDCLHARGRDLMPEPLVVRRSVLEAEVREGPRLQIARRLADDGFRAFAEARRRGLEGVIGKAPRSPYVPGVRSAAWCKVKVRAEEELVIGGFTAPRGGRQHLGALLVGAWDGAALRYAGKVGAGFTEATLADLHRRLVPLVRPQSPFADAPHARDVAWVEPQLVAQLAFTERTDDGKLRHPVFLDLRDDKSAREVTWAGSRAVTPKREPGRYQRGRLAPSDEKNQAGSRAVTPPREPGRYRRGRLAPSDEKEQAGSRAVTPPREPGRYRRGRLAPSDLKKKPPRPISRP